jgi:hypothetical protein
MISHIARPYVISSWVLLDHGLHLVICLFLGNEKGATEQFKKRFSVQKILQLVRKDLMMIKEMDC